MPGISTVKGRSDISVQDSILIGLPFGLLPGMKTLIHFLHFLDHNIRGKKAVESPLNRLDIQLTLCFKVSHLPQGMNTGIRSSGPQQVNPLVCEKGQFLFKDALQGRAFGLNLPSQIVGSFIFDSKLNGTHLGYQKSEIRISKSETNSNFQNGR
jgi:hypothetical protein